MAKDLKTANPDLKILLAIGGWNHGSEPFTDMVSTQSNIDQFAVNSLTFLRTHGFTLYLTYYQNCTFILNYSIKYV
jgi:GH18 family chitinase